MDTKRCTHCKEEKLLSEFYPIGNGVKGVRPRCKACMTMLERAKYADDDAFRAAKLKSQAVWLKDPDNLKTHRARVRRWHLKKHYGLSMEDFDALVAKQGGGCAICGCAPAEGEPKTRLVVDHCHTTNKVRGILCDLCNTALGKMEDDPVLLEKAAAYLRLTAK